MSSDMKQALCSTDKQHFIENIYYYQTVLVLCFTGYLAGSKDFLNLTLKAFFHCII